MKSKIFIIGTIRAFHVSKLDDVITQLSTSARLTSTVSICR